MFTTKNNLAPKIRAQVAAILNQSLADLSDLYSQTKQAHWNVRGPNFYSLHKLFDDLAGAVEEHLDDVAERVTALGGTAQGTVRQIAAASRLPEFPREQKDDLAFATALRSASPSPPTPRARPWIRPRSSATPTLPICSPAFPATSTRPSGCSKRTASAEPIRFGDPAPAQLGALVMPNSP